MTAHFYELLAALEVDPLRETKNLQFLFSEENNIFFNRRMETLETYIDKTLFRSLKMRGTFINISDMRNALGIGAHQLNGSLEKLFLFSEFLIALFVEGQEKLSENQSVYKQVNTIVDNITTFVDKSNHELFDAGESRFIIVEKNKAASQVVEYIEDPEIAIEVIEYNHHKLKGDLQQKQKILALLGNYIEPILKNRVLNSKYSELFSDVTFLLNCFHIRHNNKSGKNAQEFITNIDDATLEMWYDRAYNMILSVILAGQNSEYSKELSGLKQNYSWNR